jgi:hypothetical protein
MYIDSLTIAGFASVAIFALMPLLMGREFWRVSECDRVPSDSDGFQADFAADGATLTSGCVDAA